MFGHLHVHTHYSVLDGLCQVDELLRTAKLLGQEFIAITDHGSTSALWEAQNLAKEHDIKFIHGTEFYYAREDDEKKRGHMVALAKNNNGLSNIFKMQELAFTENFYYKPRLAMSMLEDYGEDIIFTTACLASTANQHIINGDITKAREWLRYLKSLLGNNIYVEIQSNSIPEQFICNLEMVKLAEQLDMPIIATNDVHYVSESDSMVHEVLLALQSNKKMSDEKRWRFDTNDFWLKTREEMFNTFEGLPEDIVNLALDNTQLIADQCSAEIVKAKYLPPFYKCTDVLTPRKLLANEIMKGAERTGFATDKSYMSDVQKELNIIDEEGYSDYFLIVQDYIKSARENNIIVGDGRGSGCGSKVAYLTGITRVEPRKFNLLFERFMSKGRSPDIDTDFSNQDAVFEDLVNKYGADSVAKIVTFGKLTPRAVCRKVLSCFEKPQAEINIISKLIPDLCPDLKTAYKDSPELLEYKEKYRFEFDIIERLEGTISHEGQHAGGIVIYPKLSTNLPIKTLADDRTKRIIAFDKDMLESIGYYKFDVLALETLPIVQESLKNIKEVHGVEIDLYKIDYNDSAVYHMLQAGDVSGVFQLNSQSQKVMEQAPTNFEDLIAINALIRPGVADWSEYIARRRGTAWSVHPDRRSYMNETSGLLAYQEQYMLDCNTFAGWELAFADKKVRKNKNILDDEELKQKFIFDSLARGYDEQSVLSVWKEITEAVSGGYGFNKSHATSYAMLSYQTAWLKHYYPKEFYASLMSAEKTDSDGQAAIAGYIHELKQRNIEVLPPNINTSHEHFTVNKNSINYRITTIKHVGESAINHIKELRPIVSFEDLLERREKKFLRANVIVNLIKAGCFDFDNPNRAELLWKFDMYNRTTSQIKENFQCERYTWNIDLKLQWEKEVFGMYLSQHPMEKYGFKPLTDYQDRTRCIQGGEFVEAHIFNDKNGNEMAFITLDTLFGRLKVIAFSSVWRNKELQALFAKGNTLLVRGTRSGKEVLLDSAEILGGE